MIVVSNTSPILNLSFVGHLNILERLYGKLFIPEAVFYELSTFELRQPIQEIPWIEVKSITKHLLINQFLINLDAGETEAIILAKETKSDILLIDERAGRKIATQLNLKFVGLLGTLIEAKHRKIITKVKPLLNELIITAGFWISNDLYSYILKETGE